MKFTPKSVSAIALCATLMYVVGFFFEIIPTGILLSYVKPNPVEGLLVIPFLLFGLKEAIITAIIYFLLLIITKGISPLLIEEMALILAITCYLFSFTLCYSFHHKHKLKTSLLGATIFTTLTMTLLNAFFITPSFLSGYFTIYTSYFANQSFVDVLKLISIPPAGILHGNIIKYFSCSIVAWLSIKVIKIKHQKK